MSRLFGAGTEDSEPKGRAKKELTNPTGDDKLEEGGCPETFPFARSGIKDAVVVPRE
jgi:hypothetical protein